MNLPQNMNDQNINKFYKKSSSRKREEDNFNSGRDENLTDNEALTENDLDYKQESPIDKKNGKSGVNTIILPSNPLKYERISTSYKTSHRDKDSNINPEKSSEKTEIFIYPINKQRHFNFTFNATFGSGSQLNNSKEKINSKKLNAKTLFQRTTSNHSNNNKIFLTDETDNSLGEKVDKLIINMQRDISLKKNQPLYTTHHENTIMLKNRLSSSLEHQTSLKTDDYFVHVIGSERKSNDLLKGVTEKIKKTNLKRNYRKEDVLSYLENQNNPKLEFKNIYEAINHRVNEVGLNYLCKAKVQLTSTRYNKTSNKDTLNFSVSPNNKDYITASKIAKPNQIGRFTSGTSNIFSRKAQQNNYITIANTSLEAESTYPYENLKEKNTTLIRHEDDFFDWDYNTRKNIKKLNLNEFNQKEYFNNMTLESPRVKYKITSPPKRKYLDAPKLKKGGNGKQIVNK